MKTCYLNEYNSYTLNFFFNTKANIKTYSWEKIHQFFTSGMWLYEGLKVVRVCRPLGSKKGLKSFCSFFAKIKKNGKRISQIQNLAGEGKQCLTHTHRPTVTVVKTTFEDFQSQPGSHPGQPRLSPALCRVDPPHHSGI